MEDNHEIVEFLNKLNNLFQEIMDESSEMSNRKDSDNEFKKDIFDNYIFWKNPKRSFVELKYQTTRENIRQHKQRIIADFLLPKFKTFCDTNKIFIDNFFNKYGNSFYSEDIFELNKYKNLLTIFEESGHPSFYINFDFCLLSNSKILPETSIEEQLENDVFYSRDGLNTIVEKYIDEIGIYYKDRQSFIDAFINTLVNNCDKLLDLGDASVFYYNSSGISNKKMLKLNYWFKELFPNGIHLPQPTSTTSYKIEIGTANLEPLYEKIPERRNQNYRAFLQNCITASDEIATFDNGHYIHSYYYKLLYADNKSFADSLISELRILLKKYGSCSSWQIFTPLKSEFRNSGIYTLEILFNLLKVSAVEDIDFVIQKELLFVKSGFDIDKQEEKANVPARDLEGIKRILNSYVLKNNINYNFSSSDIRPVNPEPKQISEPLQKINHVEEIEKIDKYEIDEENKETEALALVKVRLGHSELRKTLLSFSGKNECAICGLKNPKFLIMSHIKPWKDSDNNEKLDPENVLFLCPTHDALFDKGYITFDEDGQIIINGAIDEEEQALLNIHSESCISVSSEKQKEYLRYHNEHVFRK